MCAGGQGLRVIGLAAALTVALAVAGPAAAQADNPDGSVNPTASAVAEKQLLDALSTSGAGAVAGRVSIPDQKAANLIRPSGPEWRDFRRDTLPRLAAILIVGMLLVLALFYAVRGRIRIDAGPSDRVITRFSGLERFAHWLTAGSFVVLALTGLCITFGRMLLIPAFGHDAFSALAATGKYVHDYLGFAFMAGLALMIVLWIAHNLPGRGDLAWLKAGGGLLRRGSHPPAGKFNAGQKLIFWAVVVLGLALSVTGVLLLAPFTQGAAIGNLILAQSIHGVAAALAVAVLLAHIYIGSIGMEGAFDAMGSGDVDLNWAREHHALWVADAADKIRPKGAGGRVQPAE